MSKKKYQYWTGISNNGRIVSRIKISKTQCYELSQVYSFDFKEMVCGFIKGMKEGKNGVFVSGYEGKNMPWIGISLCNV